MPPGTTCKGSVTKKPVISSLYFVCAVTSKGLSKQLIFPCSKGRFLMQQEANLFFRSQPVLYYLDEEKPVEEK